MAGCAGYIFLIELTTVFVAAIAVYALSGVGLADRTLLWLFVLALVPGSDAAIALVDRAVTSRIGPGILPGLELADGVPSTLRTMIAMPVLLTKPEQVEELIERLEVHCLANFDGDLYFALLSDWADAETQTAPDDEIILTTAINGIAELNRRYGPAPGGGERFLVLHRHRMWNGSEGLWMGWERSGASSMNSTACCAARMIQASCPLAASPLSYRRMFVTSSRSMPTRDFPARAAKRLIGKMAHVLNRPRLDPKSFLVVEGHGIMQPPRHAILAD